MNQNKPSIIYLVKSVKCEICSMYGESNVDGFFQKYYMHRKTVDVYIPDNEYQVSQWYRIRKRRPKIRFP